MSGFEGIDPLYVFGLAILLFLLLVFLLPKKKKKKETRTAYEKSVMLDSKMYTSLENLVLKKTQHLYVGNRLVAKTKILVETVNLLKSRFSNAEQLRTLLQFDEVKSVDIEARFEALMYATGIYLNKVKKVTTVDNSILEDSPFSYWVRNKMDFAGASDIGTAITTEMFEKAWTASGLKFSYADLLNILALCLFGTVYGCWPVECLIDQPGLHIKLSLSGQSQYLRRDVHEDIPLDTPIWVMSKGKFYHLQFLKFSSAKEMGEVVKRLQEAGKTDYDVSDWLSAARMSSVSDEEEAVDIFSDLLSVDKERIDVTPINVVEENVDLDVEVKGLTSAERMEVVREKRDMRIAREAEAEEDAAVDDSSLEDLVKRAEDLAKKPVVTSESRRIARKTGAKVPVSQVNDSVVVVPSADLDLNTLTMFGIVGNSTGVDTVGMVTSIIDSSEKRTTRRKRRRIDLEEEN